MSRIKGKYALITGAASGIGQALALRLAKEGVHLHLWDIDGTGVTSTAMACRALGVEAHASVVDLCNPAEITRAASEIFDRWDGLDILINNAGVAWYGATLKMTTAEWDRLLAVNLRAPIQLTSELMPRLLVRPGSHIVNVASMFGLVATGGITAYCTSKFALVGFGEALRRELRPYHVGVTNVCPGFVRTNLLSNAAVNGAPHEQPLRVPEWMSTTAEVVADRTVRAIVRKKSTVVITAFARVLFFLQRFAPFMADALLRHFTPQSPRRGGKRKPRRKVA